MSRRFAVALLAFSIALTGVSVCTRGMLACTALLASTPDCCGDAPKLAASDCCCPARESVSSAVTSPGTLRDAIAAAPSMSATAAPLAPDLSVDSPALAVASIARALAPPDTPLTRRVTLLL